MYLYYSFVENQLTDMEITFLFSGSGVFATKNFKSGDFLLEYTGEYLDEHVGQERQIAATDTLSSNLYFFEHQQKRFW